ncbi:CPBP family intramembrane metalloprotease [Bacillus licheniformis]|nr:CPBP family intramembrane metalloprotease [Bacillus licheniformis]
MPLWNPDLVRRRLRNTKQNDHCRSFMVEHCNVFRFCLHRFSHLRRIVLPRFLYRWFRAEFGVVWALVASSALFMIAHIPTYNTLAVNFGTGLVFAWTYEKHDRLYLR